MDDIKGQTKLFCICSFQISLAVVYILNFDPVVALGFFAMGCSPGGAASNAYSYLLDGDVSLSVTMTFCSLLVALGRCQNMDHSSYQLFKRDIVPYIFRKSHLKIL